MGLTGQQWIALHGEPLDTDFDDVVTSFAGNGVRVDHTFFEKDGQAAHFELMFKTPVDVQTAEATVQRYIPTDSLQISEYPAPVSNSRVALYHSDWLANEIKPNPELEALGLKQWINTEPGDFIAIYGWAEGDPSTGAVSRVVITGTRLEIVLSTGAVDVSADVPASIADDHAAIVAWWSAEVERQEAEAETVRLEAARDDAVRRLARKARAEGVQLYRDAKDGRHYASSVSTPGRMHYVTAVSCDCMGFASHGRCMHHAALLVALGWAGDEHEGQPILCEVCRGTGSHPGTISTGRGWAYANVTCEECHGTGQATPQATPAA